jgi:predicted cupin superfamily sugar epimerase
MGAARRPFCLPADFRERRVPKHITATDVITHLKLQPLPEEGGFYRQTYVVPGPDGHPATTAILFLVTPESWSGLHRLVGDELFHAYLGDSCQTVVLTSDGELLHHRLGHDLSSGDQVQVLVPGNAWQGTKLIPGGECGWALLGTTMTPGYRHDQFELAARHDITSLPVDTREALEPFLAPEPPS